MHLATIRVLLTTALAFGLGMTIEVPELTSSSQAYAAGKRKRGKKKNYKKKRRGGHKHAHHGHGHGHDHGGHDHSAHGHSGHDHGSHTGFTLTAGTTLMQSFGGSATGSGSAGAGGDSHAGHSHAGHAHLRLLQDDHAGHDHSAGGGEAADSGESSGSGMALSFNLAPGYTINRNWSLISNIGFSTDGLLDPSAGMQYSMKLGRRINGIASLSLAAPLSEASSQSKKMTQVIFRTGPTYTTGRWTFSAFANFTYDIYAGPSAAETAASTRSPIGFGLQDDHDHEHDEGHDHDDETAAAPGTADAEEPAGHDHEEGHDHESEDALAGDHDEHDGHAHEDENTDETIGADRSQYAVGGELAAGYKLFRNFTAGVGYNLMMMGMEQGSSLFLTEARLAQAAYNWNSFNVSGWFSLTDFGAEPAIAPSTPQVGMGLGYSM